MERNIALVRAWAETIMRQLGSPAGHTLNITPADAAEQAENAENSVGQSPFTSRLRIDTDTDIRCGRAEDRPEGPAVQVVLGHADGSSTSVYLGPDLDTPQAVVLLAEQLQDSVLEYAEGTPVPECPGHGHPAVAEVVNGIPSWTCPRGTRSWPILSGTSGTAGPNGH